MWTDVIKAIDSHTSFLITSHVNPDGDSLGSEIALYLFLKSRGKNAVILNGSDTASKYHYLMESGDVLIFDETRHVQIVQDAEVIFILDTTEKERLGPLKNHVLESKAVKICIDHHPLSNHLGDLEIVDTDACATGELIFSLLETAGEEISGRIAELLYISIITDTGCFRYQNTTPQTHKIAGELIRGGVNPQKVFEEIYERNSRNRMQLLGTVLCRMVFECDGKIIWASLTREEIQASGADSLDTEGFSDILNSIAGVKISMLFKELDTGETKISLRSKDHYHVNTLAAKFGGGGHEHAAGIVVSQAMDTIIRSLVSEACTLVKNEDKT